MALIQELFQTTSIETRKDILKENIRTVVALLLISSQLEAAQPICISFSDTDVSTAQAYVSSNAIGATGGKNGTITIPRFAGGWGTYRIVFLDKGLSVKAIV